MVSRRRMRVSVVSLRPEKVPVVSLRRVRASVVSLRRVRVPVASLRTVCIVPSRGMAPSETTTIEKERPRSWRRRRCAHTSSTSNGRSGTRIASAPPAIPACVAIQPAWRPITSTTITRLWDSAVVCRRSIASVTICTAVLKPNVTSVPPRSLSIVFGTPTIGIPSSCSSSATPSVSSPPIGISASMPRRSSVARIASSPPMPSANGLVREVPRIVPPRGRMPTVLCRSSSIASSSSTPAQPWRKPRKECSPRARPLRTAARITAFSPGQSPPPVSRPMRVIATG